MRHHTAMIPGTQVGIVCVFPFSLFPPFFILFYFISFYSSINMEEEGRGSLNYDTYLRAASSLRLSQQIFWLDLKRWREQAPLSELPPYSSFHPLRGSDRIS